MIPWSCTADHGTLRAEAGRLECSTCGTAYRVVDGAPVFGVDTARASPLAEALLAKSDVSLAEAVSGHVRDGSLSRSRFMTDWDFFLPIGPSSVVLHIGPGLGDRSLALAGRTQRVLALTPGEPQARLVLRHARERGVDNLAAAVVAGLERLPLADATVDAVALDLAGAAAFGVGNADLPALVAECRRVLRPGGALMLGAVNRLLRLPGIDGMRPGDRRKTIDDALAPPGPGLPAIRPTLRALARVGFAQPNLLAPLPRREDIQIVIPARERTVARYLFDRLFRKNSRWVRMALGVAKIAAALDLVWWAVPDYFVVAELPDDPSRAGK